MRRRLKIFAGATLLWFVMVAPMGFSEQWVPNWGRLLEEFGISIFVGVLFVAAYWKA